MIHLSLEAAAQQTPRQAPQDQLPPALGPVQTPSPPQPPSGFGSGEAAASRPQAGGEACLLPHEEETALRVSYVSSAPAALCAPHYQVVEVRNTGLAALGDVRLTFSAPVGANEWSLAGRRFEISRDDGASWRAIAPPRGRGVEDDPFVWNVEEIPALARLGPYGDQDDSLLVRWRAVYGEAFGAPFASEPRLFLSASGADACARRAHTPTESVSAPLSRPMLSSVLTGRNLTRGGGYEQAVRAAPGDEIEWRVQLENTGAALARNVRLLVSDLDGSLAELDFSASDLTVQNGVLDAPNMVEQGRRSLTFRETVGPACRRRETFAEVSWGCVAPGVGRMAGLSNALGGRAGAVLVAAPDPKDVEIEQTMTGAFGAQRPGEVALVRISVRNRTAPILNPTLLTLLPDGYAFEAIEATEVLGRNAGVARVSVERTDPTSPVFVLLGADGQPATMGPDGGVSIAFRARRVRNSVLETDDISTTLRFFDECGVGYETKPRVLDARPRAARFDFSIEPVGDPIVGGAGAEASFLARFVNEGEEVARGLRMAISPAEGWASTPPEGCEAAPAAEEGAARFYCPISEDLRPGDASEFLFKLRAAKGLGRLALTADLESFARNDRTRARAPVARARTRAAAVGFRVEQKLLDARGRPRDVSDPLDIGEKVMLEVAARWFGVEQETVSNVAISQILPDALTFLDAEKADGDLSVDGVLTPADVGGRKLLWNITDFSGDGEFVGRVAVEVADAALSAAQPDLSATQYEGPPPLEDTGPKPPASVETDVIFNLGERAYGVDAQLEGPTRAEPLELSFRRADLHIAVDVVAVGPKGQETPDGADFIPAGARALARLRLINRGEAPAYLDWVRLSAQGAARLAPMADDGVDNDGDGAVDEPDEGAAAALENTAEGGALRWMALGASLRVDAGATVDQLVALDAELGAAPASLTTLNAQARFGAMPFEDDQSRARKFVSSQTVIGAPPVEGALVLSETSIGRDLSSLVRHGERVEHRLVLRFPPGRLTSAQVAVNASPALEDLQIVRFRLGRGVACEAGAAPRIERLSTDPQARLRVRLGACETIGSVSAAAEKAGRTAIIDIAARVNDVDPAAQEETRLLWRRPALSVSVSSGEGAAFEIGRSSLQIVGPVMRVSAMRAGAFAQNPLDAGDHFQAALEIKNVGDEPAVGVVLGVGSPQGGGLNCAALSLQDRSGSGLGVGGAADAAVLTEGAQSGDFQICGAPLSGAQAVIEPGAKVRASLAGRLAQTAPIGAVLRAPIRIGARGGAEGSALRASDAGLELEIAAPETPSLAAASEGPRASIVVGGPITLRTEHYFPEGAVNGRLAVRLRLRGEGDKRYVGAPSARLLSAWARWEGPPLHAARLQADVSGVASAQPRTRVDVMRAMRLETDEEGWTNAVLDLGEIVIGRGAAGRRGGRFILETVLAVADAPHASAGRMVEAAPVSEAGARKIEGAARTLGELREPYLEIAALAEPARDPQDDRRNIHALLCNRGGARAYDVRLEGVLPAGTSLDSSAPAQFVHREASAGLAPRSYGVVRQNGGVFQARAATPGAGVAPEECLELIAPIRVSASTSLTAQAEVHIAHYQSRPSIDRPGRVYKGGEPALYALGAPGLALEAPKSTLFDGPQDPSFSFRVAAGASPGPLRLRLELEGGGASWTIFHDRNEDGLIDGGDKAWMAGDEIRAGVSTAFVARAMRGAAPLNTPPPAPALLRAVTLAPSGRSYKALQEIKLRRRDTAFGAVAASRLMAVDRDCDGSLRDERVADAVFEASKEAAIGECVVMRLVFQNQDAAAVEGVVVEDALPVGVAFAPDSARFAQTPTGLVGASIDAPSDLERPSVAFRFIGVLSPGVRGAVEYRVRLSGAP